MDLHPDFNHRLADEHLDRLRADAAAVRYGRSARRAVTPTPDHGHLRIAPTGTRRVAGSLWSRVVGARRNARLRPTSPSRS
jgi:hypothetical protein